MSPVRRFLKDWLVPPGLLRLREEATRRRRVRPGVEERWELARNSRFNGIHAGRRGFVIANGPSLAKQDLRPLGTEITVTMNSFNRHPVLTEWQPTYHCVAEPGRGLTSQQVIAMLDGLEPEAHFFDLGARKHFADARLASKSNVHFLRLVGRPSEWVAGGGHVDLAQTLPAVDESSQLAILLALALGLAPIYVLGADHDWLSHRSTYRHFYAEGTGAHRVEDMTERPYDSVMRDGLRVWESHRALRALGERLGQPIYNATEGGFMDVYPVRTLAEALGDGSTSPSSG